MANIWLTRHKNKSHTLEIFKNAIHRLGPVKVALLKNDTKNQKLEIRIENPPQSMREDIVAIKDELLTKPQELYYGKLVTTFGQDKKVIQIDKICKIKTHYSFYGANFSKLAVAMTIDYR